MAPKFQGREDGNQVCRTSTPCHRRPRTCAYMVASSGWAGPRKARLLEPCRSLRRRRDALHRLQQGGLPGLPYGVSENRGALFWGPYYKAILLFGGLSWGSPIFVNLKRQLWCCLQASLPNSAVLLNFMSAELWPHIENAFQSREIAKDARERPRQTQGRRACGIRGL